jgi:hypothetical protein
MFMILLLSAQNPGTVQEEIELRALHQLKQQRVICQVRDGG